MASVLLTGGSGFLGGHLLRELRTAGHEVRALSRRAESDAALAARGALPVRAELSDVAALTRAMQGCEAVFHAAADTSLWRARAAAQTATNVAGTRNLLHAAEAARVGAFVHTSSVSAFSHLVSATLDESVRQRGGESWINYERSKFLGEQAVRHGKVPWIVFNPGQILGPGDRHGWARLIGMVDREQLPGVPPGCGSFADVREIAAAQVRAWQLGRFGQAYLVGGENASLLDFVQRVGSALGRRTPARPTPAWAMRALAHVLDGWSRLSGREPRVTPEAATLTTRQLTIDSTKAKRELGYRETPLDALLADTLAWMRAERLIGADRPA